jgi:hypothetical protein
LCNCGFKRFPKKCNYRICSECGRARSFKFYKKYLKHLKKRRIARSIYDGGLRFLTLTIENQKALSEGITKLNDSFIRLNRRTYFKNRVSAGIGVIDIKRGKDGLWNLHIHFLIDSKYLDVKSHKQTGEDAKLVQEWKHSTNGSGILYIERVRGYEGSLGYVLKYLTKGIADLSIEEKASFFKQIFGRRLLFTFGEFYKIKEHKEQFFCEKCGLFYQYIGMGTEEYEYSRRWFEPPPDPPPTILDFME